MAALEEYKRNEPESQIEYRTMQLDHKAFTQPYRLVSSKTAKTFIIDGQAVVFEPAGREDR